MLWMNRWSKFWTGPTTMGSFHASSYHVIQRICKLGLLFVILFHAIWLFVPSRDRRKMAIRLWFWAVKSQATELSNILNADARWHSREDVKKALAHAEYKKAQRTAATRVGLMCRGVEKSQSLSADLNVESGELAPMFFPGPFAIAHHLISSWASENSVVNGVQTQLRFPSGSLSSL